MCGEMFQDQVSLENLQQSKFHSLLLFCFCVLQGSYESLIMNFQEVNKDVRSKMFSVPFARHLLRDRQGCVSKCEELRFIIVLV